MLKKYGQFHPCDFAVASGSNGDIFWVHRPLQRAKPISDRFPKADVDWSFEKFALVSPARKKLSRAERGSLGLAIERGVMARRLPSEVWVKFFSNVSFKSHRKVPCSVEGKS